MMIDCICDAMGKIVQCTLQAGIDETDYMPLRTVTAVFLKQNRSVPRSGFTSIHTLDA